MFCADVIDDHGKFQKQIVCDVGLLIELIEQYCLDKDLISPLQYIARVYEIK